MNKKRTFLQSRILFLICMLSVCMAVFVFFRIRNLNVTYESISGTESGSLLSNPYCGFYQIQGYVPSDKHSTSYAEKWVRDYCEDNTDSLVLFEVNLQNYRDSDLSQKAIKQIDSILSVYKELDKQVIIRFLYDWDGKINEAEPSDISRIYRHITQTSALVNKYKENIYILQGNFTGNYGEMHGTQYGGSDQVRDLISAIAEAVDPSIYLAVRTPAHLRSILKTDRPLSSSTAFGNALSARLSLYNDGMLGSVYDLGTYDDTPMEHYSEQGTREEELAFQNVQCQFVPNGGEVVYDTPYNDLDAAVRDLSMMHVSYLNREYDLKVLDKWKASTYTGEGVFRNTNGYDYIQAHLGYRYVLTDSELRFHSFLDDRASLYLTIENTGFAPAYRLFASSLRLTDEETKETQDITLSIDNRIIPGGDSSIFTVTLDIRDLNPGTYQCSLAMQDPLTGLDIHFANDNAEKDGSVPIGTLTIQ